jgi:hypothetical protein
MKNIEQVSTLSLSISREKTKWQKEVVMIQSNV